MNDIAAKRLVQRQEDLRKRRAGQKAYITRRLNEVSTLLKALQDGTKDPCVKQFEVLFDRINKAFQDLKQTNDELCDGLCADDAQKEYSSVLDIETEINDTVQLVNTTLKEQATYMPEQEAETLEMPNQVDMLVKPHLDETNRQTEIENEKEVQPEDSISQTGSHGSRQSKLSSVASQRVKAAATAARLAAEAKNLQRLQELELAELKIKQQKTTLEINTQLEAATAEQEVYDSLELETQSLTSNKLHSVTAPLSTVPRRQSQMGPRSAIQATSRTMEERADSSVVSAMQTMPEQNSSTAAAMSELQTRVQPSSGPPTATKTLEELVYTGQQQQQKILDTLRLPKIELSHFDGDPLKYWLFVHQFENCVNENHVDDAHKLLMLLQYCTGKARQVIECCTAMEPSYGFDRAMSLLKERFGNEFVIADAWVKRVADGPVIGNHDKIALRDFADELRNSVENLSAMGHLTEVNTQRVLLKIVQRLPSFLRNRWLREVQQIRKHSGRNPGISDLASFCDEAAVELNDPVYGSLNFGNRGNTRDKFQNVATTKQNVNRSRGSNFSSSVRGKAAEVDNDVTATKTFRVTSEYNGPPCKMCEQKHTLFNCEKFKSLTTEERRRFAADERLCFNCLKAGHEAVRCRLTRTCTIDGCNRKHTKFLHPVTPRQNFQPKLSEPSQQNQATCNATEAGVKRTVTLPILPVRVKAPTSDKCIITHALLDSGSTNSFCTEELAGKLGLEGERRTLCLTTLDQADSKLETKVVSLEITGLNSDKYTILDGVFAKSVIPISSDRIGRRYDCAQWPHLRDLNITDCDTTVELLIGQDNPDILLPREVRSGQPGAPYATRTILGWTVNGPLGLENSRSRQTATSNFVSMDTELQKQVENFWKVEDWEATLSEKPSLSVEDQQAIDIWKESIQIDDTGHYTLDIPFRHNLPNLPPNRQLAENRLQGLKRRLCRDDKLFAMYKDTMQDLIDRGYAEKIDVDGPVGATWYLPHHPVVHPQKPGRIRIVFDCSAKQDGVSLNDAVLQGPDLTNSLLGVLLRFRQGQVAMMADIQAMFHQVCVTPEQRDVLRFLWWEHGNLSNEPSEYRMTAHLFGGKWSPSCCNFVLHRTAEDNKSSFRQDVVKTVFENFYVDDCLVSVDNEDEAVMIAKDIPRLLAAGGFTLTKWVSNSRKVLAEIPEEHRAKGLQGLDLNFEALPVERALGVTWNVEDDTFEFVIKYPDKPLTRRGLLSTISSIYDPMGFLIPFTVTARKILQDLTRKKLGWDEPLQEEDRMRWQDWIGSLQEISRMKIPRCFGQSTGGRVRIQLYHFSDASEISYGSVSFLRSIDDEGNIKSTLIMSRSRIAPMKTMSIPRLELAAAALSVKTDQMLRQELNMNIDESIFWTDSTIVLGYIANMNRRFQTYVANRVSLIHAGSSIDQWRHITSDQNPADDVSRGLSAKSLVESSRWLSGPSFLQLAEEDWPRSQVGPCDVSKLETKQDKVAALKIAATDETESATDKLIQHFSSFYKLKKAVAWMLRLKRILKDRVNKQAQEASRRFLTVNEMRSAEQAIAKYVQVNTLQHEMKILLDDTAPLKSKSRSPLYKLQPILNDAGLMCVGGRLKNSLLPEKEKHPVILPKRHHVVDLIVRDQHETLGHAGREHVHSEIQKRYWIISGRQAVRRVLRACFVCKRNTKTRGFQRMADLPPCRLRSDHPPFTFVGIDLFVPFIVRRGRSDIKRYGCVFTCLTMRAIHLEVTHSLDTDSFLNALVCFMSRRGRPHEIYCDNGTNFVGAEKQLTQAIRQWNQAQLHDFLLQREIVWNFNPLASSHMGGSWERMIRIVRKLMTPLLAEQTLDDEGLTTVLCAVEYIINGRPLTAVSDDTK